MRGGWGGLSWGPRGQANVTVSSQVSHSATAIVGSPPIPSPTIPSGELLLSRTRLRGLLSMEGVLDLRLKSLREG